MEGLTRGWYRTTHLNGRWHYYDGNGSHSVCTLVFSDKQKDYLERFEIIEGILCSACDSLVNSNELLLKAQKIMGKVLLKRICSEDGCSVSGVAYVPVDKNEEKQHYCTKHNLRITEILKNKL